MKIKFNSDGKWSGGGVLPGHLLDFSDLAVWIKAFLSEVADIRKKYLSAMSDDGRLLGQEKADLVIEMDEVIAGLLLFRRYISADNSSSMSTAGNEEDFIYNITIHDSTWLGEGRLAFSDEIKRMSFTDLHNYLIMDRVKEIFILYGKICSDRIISSDERLMMFMKIDEVLRDFMRIERALLFSNMAK